MKKIFDECVKGNFESTLNYVNSCTDGHISHNTALSIVISCCHACSKKKDDISEDLLFKILNRIVPFLKDFNETTFHNYLLALHHIIKFLIDKGSLEVLVGMEEILLKKYQQVEITKIHTDSYQSITKLLANILIRAACNKQCFNDSLYKISMLTLKMCAKFLNSTILVNIASECFLSLCNMKASVKFQIDYYNDFLHLLDQVEYSSENLFKTVHTYPCSILNSILLSKDFEIGITFLNNTDSNLGSILKSDIYIHFFQVLRYFLILKITDKSTEIIRCQKSLKILNNILKDNDCKLSVITKLNKLLQSANNYFKSNPEEWSKLSSDLQLQCFKFISILNDFQVSTKNVSVVEDLIFYGYIIYSLIKVYITDNDNSSLIYHQNCIEILTTFFNHIESLKKSNYVNWSQAWYNWTKNVINIGIVLHQYSAEAATEYFHLVLKYFFKCEDVNTTLLINYKSLESLCSLLIRIHQSDPKMCLSYTSLAIYLCSNSRDMFLKTWVNYKYSNQDDLKLLNLVDALNNLRNWLPDVFLNDSDKINLLTIELQYYKTKWKSSKAIVSTLKGLQEFSDTEYFINILATTFIDFDIINKDDFSEILTNTLNKYKKFEKNIDQNICWAVLHFFYYKNYYNKLILDNVKDMEKTASTAPEPLESNVNNEDNYECEITSFYKNLELEEFLIILKKLDKALSIFKTVIPKLTSELKNFKLSQLYSLLLKVSNEYKLLRYNCKSVDALELALKIAQLLNNTAMVIKAVSFIIEQSNLNYENLIDYADKLIADKNYIQSENLEICVLYYICKSKVLLDNNSNEFCTVFKKAREMAETIKSDEDSYCLLFIKSYLFLLNCRSNILPCNFVMGSNILSDAISALNILDEHFNNKKADSSFTLSLFFHVSDELLKILYYFKFAEELHSYGKNVLLMAQNLVLPLHTVSCLRYTALSDLFYNRSNLCLLKVKDMTAVLNIKDTTKSSNDFKQLSPSSPGFTQEIFDITGITKHNITCNCYYCDCSEYQGLVLETLRLRALINIKENNNHIAIEFFEGALQVYEYYSQKSSKHKNFDFYFAYAYNLLNYSTELWKLNRKEKAMHVNKILSDSKTIKNKKLPYLPLYTEVLIQKLSFLTNILVSPVHELEIKMDNLQIKSDEYLIKTPESKQTTVSIVVDNVDEYYSPPKCSVKNVLDFDTSPGTEIKLPQSLDDSSDLLEVSNESAIAKLSLEKRQPVTDKKTKSAVLKRGTKKSKIDETSLPSKQHSTSSDAEQTDSFKQITTVKRVVKTSTRFQTLLSSSSSSDVDFTDQNTKIAIKKNSSSNRQKVAKSKKADQQTEANKASSTSSDVHLTDLCKEKRTAKKNIKIVSVNMDLMNKTKQLTEILSSKATPLRSDSENLLQSNSQRPTTRTSKRRNILKEL